MRMRLVIAALILAWTVEARASTPTLTPAQAEAFGRLYADAVNSDPGIDAFLELDDEPVPDRAIRGFFEDQRWISGGVELVGARQRPGDPAIVEIAVRSRLYGAVQGVELTLLGEAEPHITYLDLTPAPSWAVAPKAPASRAAVARRIRRLVEKGCSQEVFSGAVLVAAGDQILLQHACGEASRRHHVPNRTSTRFNLGSMDKMFTAAAVMQLADQGRLSLDAPVARYLDATWLDPETAGKVTVWQLMTHTGGLSPDIVDLAEQQPRARYRDLGDYRPLALQVRTSFPPGSRFEYSNTGMLLLGAVIEKASGEDYYDYVRKHVLLPAGMTSTGSIAADDPVEDVAMGYIRTPGTEYGWRENTVRNFVRGIPAGGGYATVGDLHRFAVALESGKLLPAAALERLWTDGRGYNYGAGFEIGGGAIGRNVGHSGLYGGVSTRLRIYRDRGYLVVVLANIDRAAPPLVDAIEGELLAAPVRVKAFAQGR